MTETAQAFGAARANASSRRSAGGRASRVLRRLALGVALAGTLVCGYLGGDFIRFTQDVSRLAARAGDASHLGRADGIVVLTGGALRLDQAIGLLKEGHAERLLISGVNPGTSIATLSKLTATDRALFDCCVDLDYQALNTIGNAEMTERWARARGFDDVILVTSDYHMPRTLLEFRRLSHAPLILPYPVSRTDLWTEDQMPTARGIKVLLTEYAKLLAARLRLHVVGEGSTTVSRGPEGRGLSLG